MISLKQFTGEFPRTAPQLLPDNAATDTLDCDFTANVLTGINDFANPVATGLTSVRSVFVYPNSDSGALVTKTYAWQTDADVVRGPIANDAYDRMYWTAAPDYALKVTRDALAGGGYQPDPLKTYDLGVPAPLLAPTAITNAFTYNGARLTDIVAICETPTGTVLSADSIMSIAKVSYDTATGLVATATYAAKCRIYSESTAQMSGTLPVGFLPAGSDVLYTGVSGQSAYLPNVLNWYTDYTMTGGTATPVQKYTFNGDTYYHWPDWLYAPLGNTIYTPQVFSYTTAGSGGGDFGGPLVPPSTVYLNNGYNTFTHIGSGWYCSRANATPPTGSGNTGSSLAIRLYFGTDYVTLRETADRSTITTAGYFGSFIYQNGILEMDISMTNSSTLVEDRLYCYTYVNIFGEESAPSPLLEISVKEGYQTDVTMAGLTSTTYAPIAKIRLYRSATGTTNTALLFAGEFDNASTVNYTDSLLASALGEPISTIGFMPPETGLRGLQALPNGILYAFKDNEIHFCQPYLPYAWKRADIMTTADTVVGTCPAEGGFYITTRSVPYFVSGVTPDAMSQMKLTSIQAGVTKGSICNIGPAVVWASNDGLVTASGGNVSLDWSFKYFTRNDWRRLYADRLDKMRLSTHDGHLVCWFDDGSPGFLMRFDENDLTYTKLSRGIYAACVHPKNDELYVCVDGSTLYAFKHYAANRRPFLWQSKDFIVPSPANFGAIQIVGSGTVTVTVTADGVLRSKKTVTLDDMGKVVYRMPSGFLGRKWVVQLVGTGVVNEFNMAVSPQEFAGV